MAEFGQLQGKKKDTAIYTFDNLSGEPKFVVKYAGEANKPYFNEMLRRAEHQQKRKAKLNVALLEGNRDRDRELYPQFIIVGWQDVVDINKKPVAFSQEDLKGFMKVNVDDEEFDGLRAFCRDVSNFREVNDGEAAAGNSAPA